MLYILSNNSNTFGKCYVILTKLLVRVYSLWFVLLDIVLCTTFTNNLQFQIGFTYMVSLTSTCSHSNYTSTFFNALNNSNFKSNYLFTHIYSNIFHFFINTNPNILQLNWIYQLVFQTHFSIIKTINSTSKSCIQFLSIFRNKILKF